MLIEYTVKKEDDGKTVKQIIEHRFALSSRLLSRLKNEGGIKTNGVPVTVRYIVKQGDILTLQCIDKSEKNIEPVNIPLDVLYEDDSILAVNKPLGMPTHPSFGHHTDTLANAVMYRYRHEGFTFRAITRLDADTTGVVLVARDPLSAQRLTKSLGCGKLSKEYTALVDGIPKNEKGSIEEPIARCEDSVIKRKIHESGKYALTHYQLLQVCPDGIHSLIKAYPVTGRTHQIRLHLSHIGIPIYGDFLYGNAIDGVRAHLHCSRLTFPHPVTGESICVFAPLPQDIADFLKE